MFKRKKDKKKETSEPEAKTSKKNKKAEATESEPSSSKQSGKGSKKLKVSVKKGVTDTGNVITVTAGIPDSYTVTKEPVTSDQVNAGKGDKKDSKKGKAAKGTQETKTKDMDSEKVTVGKKRKAPEIVVTAEATPNKVLKGQGKPDVSSRSVNTELKEGETEIFVPNKKYLKAHGTPQTTPTTSKSNMPKAALFKFDKSRPPMAFVKKSQIKVDKRRKSVGTPGSAKSMSERDKRVSFDMKKNKAQGKRQYTVYLIVCKLLYFLLSITLATLCKL